MFGVCVCAEVKLDQSSLLSTTVNGLRSLNRMKFIIIYLNCSILKAVNARICIDGGGRKQKKKKRRFGRGQVGLFEAISTHQPLRKIH